MNDSIKNSPPRLPWLVLSGAVLLAISSLAVTSKSENKESQSPPKPTAVALTVSDRPIARDGKFITSFSPVVKKVGPSVVKVFTSTKAKFSAAPEFPGFDNPFFRRFFGDEFGGPGRQPQLRTPPQHGIGSGVIVTKDGYILTNNHVVDGADEVKVALQDGREFTAKVVGKDPKTDVAVVKVETKDLPAIEIADSDKIDYSARFPPWP